jgi:conjugative relaxase-like TrwC/TraI family protein
MMRPTRIRGVGALSYYLKLIRERQAEPSLDAAEADSGLEDYYLAGGETSSEWFGQSAKALGLQGAGTRAQMAALLDGRHPVSGEQLGQRPRPDGVRAYDLTFSAPKSVSVLASLLGSDGERFVVRAHDEAVRAALGMLQGRATTRAGKNGTRRLEADGLTTLLVRHRTSRTLDPQLHTHVLLFAKVQGSDGRWRALDGSILFRAQRTFGAVYQSALRSELTATLGVNWEPVSKGQAEIAGLDELTALFSRRSDQIAERVAEKLAEFGQRHAGREPTERERAIMTRDAARESRPAKERAQASGWLYLQWSSLAAEHGWDTERLRAEVLHRARTVSIEQSTESGEYRRVAAEAVRALSEQKSVWTIEEIERELAARMPTSNARTTHQQTRAIEALASEAVAELCVDLVAAASPDTGAASADALFDSGLERYTTPELMAQEQRIVHWLDAARGVEGHAASEEVVLRGYAREAREREAVPTLDADQAHALALVAGDHRAVAVVGPAGAGKTQTLAIATQALHAQRHQVVGIAPSAVAAKRLQETIDIHCDTVEKFLRAAEAPERGPRVERSLSRGDTLIVDEAGMLSTPDWERILTRADADGFRVVFVGDPRQLAPVGRGGMFDQAIERLPAAELMAVHRFDEPWEAAASLLLRAAEPVAIDAYVANGRVRFGTAEEMSRAMVDDWRQAWLDGATSAFSAPTNEQVRHLNELARQERLLAGEIDDACMIENTRQEPIGVGDLVATRQNARRMRLLDGSYVKNRDTWIVAELAQDGSAILRAANGPHEIVVPEQYMREHVELAYFRTTHGVQGITHSRGGTLVDQTAGFRSLYTGATRGRELNRLYVVCEPDEAPHDVIGRALGRDRADLGVLAQHKAIKRRVDALVARRELQPQVPEIARERAIAREAPGRGLAPRGGR